MCNAFCKDFQKEICSKLLKPPYVCNGCGSHSLCSLEKRFYYAADAQKEYKLILSESRSGLSLSEVEVAHLEEIVSPLIHKKHSPHHNCKVDKTCRIGRTFDCFNTYLSEHPDFPIVQLDSVEGKKGGKVLLTIHFVKTGLMPAFLREHNDSQSVIDIFERLYLEFRPDRFMTLFKVCLADNGSEFSNPRAIEYDRQDNLRTCIFYCDPSAPCYEAFSFFYEQEALDFPECRLIPPKEATLSSSVFRKEVQS